MQFPVLLQLTVFKYPGVDSFAFTTVQSASVLALETTSGLVFVTGPVEPTAIQVGDATVLDLFIKHDTDESVEFEDNPATDIEVKEFPLFRE